MRLEGRSSSLVDHYRGVVQVQGFSPREKIEETLQELEEGNSVILTAPTGYGKSSVTAALGLASLRGNDLFHRVIHVLPLRSIVQDMQGKLRDLMLRLGFTGGVVGAQDMDFHDSPFFLRKVNVTTLDTFVLNLFKLPASELGKSMRGGGAHFEVPRAAILSSVVVFDEFHLFSEEGKAFSAALASLRSLARAGVPFVIATATLPDPIRDQVLRALQGFPVKEVSTPHSPVEREIQVEVLSSEEEVFKVERGKRTLVVFNTRKGAIEAYRRFRTMGLNPVLIHSKFNSVDRRRKVRELDRAELVISTQVIEAGVDKSFDVLITEAAPAPNLIQRAGRVARYGGRGVVKVFPFSGAVYDRGEVERTMKEVERNRVVDQSLMHGIDHSPDLDHAIMKSLEIIDDNPNFFHAHVSKILREECSLTREVSLVLGFPPGQSSAQYAVPLTEREALGVLEGGGKAVRGGEPVDFKPDHGLCLWVQLMEEGLDGVQIPHYSPEEGAKLGGETQ
jgi:CRISPR-associated endonuclease/helicase Cas3